MLFVCSEAILAEASELRAKQRVMEDLFKARQKVTKEKHTNKDLSTAVVHAASA